MKDATLIVVFVIYFILHYFIDENLQNTGKNFYKDKDVQIYDVIHENTPDYRKYQWFGNVYEGLCFLPFILFWNKDAFIEFISFAIIILAIRDVTTTCTILPKTGNCNPTKYFDIKQVTNPEHFVNSTNSPDKQHTFFGACYDLNLSGHFSLAYLATLIYYKYKMITNIPLLVLINVINACIILLTRSHYTSDVIFAFITTALVFSNNLQMNRFFTANK